MKPNLDYEIVEPISKGEAKAAGAVTARRTANMDSEPTGLAAMRRDLDRLRPHVDGKAISKRTGRPIPGYWGTVFEGHYNAVERAIHEGRAEDAARFAYELCSMIQSAYFHMHARKADGRYCADKVRRTNAAALQAEAIEAGAAAEAEALAEEQGPKLAAGKRLDAMQATYKAAGKTLARKKAAAIWSKRNI